MPTTASSSSSSTTTTRESPNHLLLVADEAQQRRSISSNNFVRSNPIIIATDPPQPPSIFSRVVSGSIGSIVTALAVTPLEVVKVRQQAAAATQQQQQQPQQQQPQPQRPVVVVPHPNNVKPCPRGCGTFVFNNGLQECVLPKSAVPYFDKTTGRLTEKARKSCWMTSTTTLSSSTNSAAAASLRPLGTFAMVRRIFVNEGFTGIYAGLSPTLVMSVPSTVLYFTVYDEIVSRLRQRQQQQQQQQQHYVSLQLLDDTHHNGTALSWWIPLVGGSSARILTTLAVAPLELIRTRQASVVAGTVTTTTTTTTSDGTSSMGLWSELKHIVKTEGIASLYKGLAPTLWRDVPFSALYWLSVERLREFWKSQSEESSPPTPLLQAGQAFVNGALSGMVAAAATTPFDVVKTRQQMVVMATTTSTTTTLAEAEATLHAQVVGGVELVCHHDGAFAYRAPPLEASSTTTRGSRPMGTFGLLQHIYETEGLAGLWRGNQTRMIKIAPACAIMISCYELGKRLLD